MQSSKYPGPPPFVSQIPRSLIEELDLVCHILYG